MSSKQKETSQQKEETAVFISSPALQSKWKCYAVLLLLVTVIWNVIEGIISVWQGWMAGDLSLFAFGCDSFIEVISASMVLFHMIAVEFRRSKKQQIEKKTKKHSNSGSQSTDSRTSNKSLNSKSQIQTETTALKSNSNSNTNTNTNSNNNNTNSSSSALFTIEVERKLTLFIGCLLVLFAVFAMLGAVYRLVFGQTPDSTIWGIIVSLFALVAMFILWYYKSRAAVILNSATLNSDALCSMGCIKVSSALLIGSILFEVSEKLWFADSATTIVIALLVGYEGFQTVRAAKDKENFSGGCGCCSASADSTLMTKYLTKQLRMEYGTFNVSDEAITVAVVDDCCANGGCSSQKQTKDTSESGGCCDHASIEECIKAHCSGRGRHAVSSEAEEDSDAWMYEDDCCENGICKTEGNAIL